MIGTDCYEAALGYVRRKAVVRQVWLPGQNALSGLVRGRYGEFYMPTVYFSGQGPMLEVRGAQCSCDARYACEHAAALLVSAVGGGADTAGMPTVPRQVRRPPSWDTPLESLLAAGHQARRPDEATLAIELTLVADLPQLHGQPRPLSARAPAAGPKPAQLPVRLMARLVQPGKNAGWIGGTLSWGKLDSYGYFGGYPATQVRLLQELLALYRTRVNKPNYRAVRTRPEGGDDHRHAGPQRRRPGPGHRGRRRRGHLVHAAPPGLRRPPGGGMVRSDLGRGPVREEPPVEDLPVRAPAASPVQGRYHRHADGETT